MEDLQPDRCALQQPHAAARRDRVRLPRHHRQEARRARLRPARRHAARRRVRSRATSSSATRPDTGAGEVRTAEQLVAHARDAEAHARLHARTSSRAASSRPTTSSKCYRALGAGVPRRSASLRSERAPGRVEEALRFGQAIEDLNNDYFEDPTWGLERHAARCARSSRSRPPPTRSSSTSSSSPPTSAIRRST